MFCFRVGADWTEICEQPELRLSSTLEFDPDTTETVTLPLTQSTPKIVQLSESDSTRQDTEKSPSQCELPSKTTENALDVKELPTESKDDKQASPCTNEEPASTSVVKPADDKSKKVFVFSVDNVPSGSYYLTHPNKYVFPGSTHKWYGSGDKDKDREEIFEEEDDDDDEFEIGFDDDDDDDDDDDNEENDDDDAEDDDKCETESSTNHDENSDSDKADALKANDSVVLGKRLGPAEIETESVSPVKQQKTEDE